LDEFKGRIGPDKNLIGMAGEFLVAGQLFKRGYLASVTLGNAKTIDILVHNPRTRHNFNVQVKTSQGQQGGFFFKRENVRPSDIYVFVILNGPSEHENYFLVKGETILNDINTFFGEKPSKVSGIAYKSLCGFEDKWKLFDESEPPY
jgi:hypothetical protein